MTRCVVDDCPAWRRPCGCGYLSAGTPCRHPRWRDLWAALTGNGADQRPADPGLLRRAEAAQRPLTPERARQLILHLEEVNNGNPGT